jgi:hypothetical protein
VNGLFDERLRLAEGISDRDSANADRRALARPPHSTPLEPAGASRPVFLHWFSSPPTLVYADYSAPVRAWRNAEALRLGPGRGLWAPRRGSGGFVLRPDADDAALEAQLREPIDARPLHPAVFSVSGSDLRIGWMRRRLAGFHVFFDREPQETFTAAGEIGFFEERLLIAERNAASRLFDYPASLLKLRGPLASALFHNTRYHRGLVSEAAPAALYAITFHAWLLRLLHGLSFADVVVDAELARTAEQRLALSERIGAATGVRLDFTLASSPRAAHPAELADQAAVEREVLDCLPMSALAPFIDRTKIARRLGEIAPRKAAVIDRIL